MADLHSHSSLPRLPLREPTGHKGTFGTVAVLGGCAAKPDPEGPEPTPQRMIGGPALAALAALRCGCGLARLVMPEPIIDAALTIAPSATGIPLPVDHRHGIVPHSAAEVIDHLLDTASCIAVGPGLGVSDGARAAAFRCIAQDELPVVVDADALNNLAHLPELTRDFRAPAVLTPHLGEFRRLASDRSLNIGIEVRDEAGQSRAAEALAQRLGCVVVLKSATTVVSDGQTTWVHAGPNPALATAGTGDVLTGVIASFIAQFFGRGNAGRASGGLSLLDCARLGVAAHARAARLWCARREASAGLLASDLVDELPEAVEWLRGSGGRG